MPNLIYKITPQSEWQNAVETGVFAGAAIDLKDGYIHFSTASQVPTTAALHFAGQNDLLLVAVDGNMLGDTLKFEPSRGGELFPHLYAALPLDAVVWTAPMPLDENGNHVLPDLREQ